jgi:hypothetical protein
MRNETLTSKSVFKRITDKFLISVECEWYDFLSSMEKLIEEDETLKMFQRNQLRGRAIGR